MFFKCIYCCSSSSRSLYITVISRMNSNNNAFCRRRNKRKAKWQWVKWLKKTTTCIWITHDSNWYDVGQKCAPFLFIVSYMEYEIRAFEWLHREQLFFSRVLGLDTITQLSNNFSRSFLNRCLLWPILTFLCFECLYGAWMWFQIHFYAHWFNYT